MAVQIIICAPRTRCYICGNSEIASFVPPLRAGDV